MEEKIYFGNIKGLEITPKEDYLLVSGIAECMDTEFETKIYHDGKVETHHCGVGQGFIWTDWQKDLIIWG